MHSRVIKVINDSPGCNVWKLNVVSKQNICVSNSVFCR